METTAAFWIAAAVASLFVGMGKGGMPMVAMLAVPTLSFFMAPAYAAGLILPVYLVSDLFGVWLYRREFSATNLKILLPAAVVGTTAGFLTVAAVPPDAVRLAVGAVGLYYLTDKQIRRLRAPRPPRPADLKRGLFWGTIAGYTSYLTHAGGPPFQTYMLPQKLPKMVFAGTSTIFFACVNMMKVVPYIAAGQMTRDSVAAIVWLTPVAVFGAWAGYRLTRILPERLFFVFVELALLAMSLRLIWDGLTG